ncbi:MAG: phage tail assembly protein [Synergistaceae bacterium]|nr:phage tail assembly protein [Synergistaceae bacterium]
MKIKLKKAINFHGEELKELDLNLDNLTGNDLIEAEKQVMMNDNIPMITDFNKSYLIAIAGRVLNIPAETLRTINAKDFSSITSEVQRFLLNSDSSETEKAEIPATVHETSSEESL